MAQLGARLTGSQKVTGSNPVGSTKLHIYETYGGLKMKKLYPLIVGVIALVIPLVVCAAPRPAKRGKNTEEEDAVADSLVRIEAEKYLSIGVDFYSKKLYTEAIENYNKSLEYVPDYYAAMVAMAKTYQDMMDLEPAHEWYRKAYETHPDSVAGYLGLGGIYLIKASIDPLYYDSALAIYQEGVAKFPGESDLYHGIASVFENKGGVKAADSVYVAGLGVNPDNLGLRNSYVNFLTDHDRYEEAYENELYIVNAKPEDFIAREKLGDIAMKLKKYTEAEEAYLKVIELRPEDVDVRVKLANLYLIQKKYASAEKRLKKAIELDSTKLVPRIYLGVVYINWGKEGQAEATFKEILSLDKNNGDALYFMGTIYVRRATRAVKQTTKEAWQAGCANARTADSYLRRAISADPSSNSGRANKQLEYLEKVRAELKKKLFLQGITEC